MPADADHNTDPRPTLGQRIDAMLGPLDQDAQAFREAITSGRAQMAQMQARIDQAEQALGGIEEQMIRVLKSLAAEEPMLALAMGASDELPPAFPTATPETPAIEPGPAPAMETPSAQTPEVVTLEMTMLPDADEVPAVAATPEEDAAAVDEILGLLDADPGLAEFDASPAPGSPLAAAAAQADEIARALDGVGE